MLLLYAHAYDVIGEVFFALLAVRVVERVAKVMVSGMKQAAKNRNHCGGDLVNLVFSIMVGWKAD